MRESHVKTEIENRQGDREKGRDLAKDRITKGGPGHDGDGWSESDERKDEDGNESVRESIKEKDKGVNGAEGGYKQKSETKGLRMQSRKKKDEERVKSSGPSKRQTSEIS